MKTLSIALVLLGTVAVAAAPPEISSMKKDDETPETRRPDKKKCDCESCKECKLEVPEHLYVYVGRDALLAVRCKKRVTIMPPDEDDDITIMPSFVENTYVVKAYQPGTYRIIVAVSSADSVKIARITVTAVARKPRPKPGPDPPAPAPAPAPPADPLALRIGNAYRLDETPDKAKWAKSLAELYRVGADKVKAAESGARLLAEAREAAKSMGIPDDALSLVRSALSVEIRKVVGSGELTEAKKVEIKALFLRISGILDTCK